MKNKKLTYILLPIVILIWGYAIFQIFWKGKPEVNYTQEVAIADEELLQDSLQFKMLSFDFSDPFLKRNIFNSKIIVKSRKRKKTTSVRRKPTAKKPIIIKWPIIKYGGTVNSIKALVSINRKLEILNINDVFEAVTINEIFSDSIKVEFKEEHRVIVKNKF